jgi:hypothetical protein
MSAVIVTDAWPSRGDEQPAHPVLAHVAERHRADRLVAPGHGRCTAMSFFAGCLNSFAAFSIASRSSTASISPTHWRFAASL